MAILGPFVHVCKLETLREAYALAKRNDGSPGIDGVTFEAIEAGGVERFIGQIREELVTGEYLPLSRRQEIPKDGRRQGQACWGYLRSGTGWCRERSS